MLISAIVSKWKHYGKCHRKCAKISAKLFPFSLQVDADYATSAGTVSIVQPPVFASLAAVTARISGVPAPVVVAFRTEANPKYNGGTQLVLRTLDGIWKCAKLVLGYTGIPLSNN